jgi:methyltransferase (TIGR00027 family)
VNVSSTSQAVAMTRAEFHRPHSADGDPDAQRRLCAGMRSVVLADRRASLAARTKFFDDQVMAAISAGVAQIVVLGAGYDDRALRFRAPGVTFFELDHPGTQADKIARLTAILAGGGPVLLAADFRLDDLAAVLAASRHDAARPSLFLCEGLLVYLDQPSTVRMLAGVRAAAAPGSALAASLAVHRDGLDSARVLAQANARRRTAAAEPWLTILPAHAQAELLVTAGWRITQTLDEADLGTGADRGRSLLVTADPAS